MNKFTFNLIITLNVLAVIGACKISAKSPEALNEINITGSSIPKLDLSRSSILTQDQVEDRQIDNLVDLSG